MAPPSKVHGINIDPNSYRRHPLHPQILLINGHEYADLVSKELSNPYPPHRVLFPFLHGADRAMNSHTAYFLGRTEACPPPLYAGLVSVVTSPSESSSLSPVSTYSANMGTSSSLSSTSSTSLSSSTSSNSKHANDNNIINSTNGNHGSGSGSGDRGQDHVVVDDEEDDDAPTSFFSCNDDTLASLPGGPEPRPSILVSSLDTTDIFGPQEQEYRLMQQQQQQQKQNDPANNNNCNDNSNGNNNNCDNDSLPIDFHRPPLPPHVSLRNYFLQPSQYSSISHIVVYDPNGPTDAAVSLANRIELAQRRLRSRRLSARHPAVQYYTLLLTDPISSFERNPALRHLVAVDSSCFARNKIDFAAREHDEMDILTRASLVNPNFGVWLGNAADVPIRCKQEQQHEQEARQHIVNTENIDNNNNNPTDNDSPLDENPLAFSICIEARDVCAPPQPEELQMVERHLDSLASNSGRYIAIKNNQQQDQQQQQEQEQEQEPPAKLLCPDIENVVHLSVPSSVNCALGNIDQLAQSLVIFAQWLANQTNICPNNSHLQRRALIFSSDGYIDSSLFALIFVMVSQNITLHDAYIYLHIDRNRGFYVHQDDRQLLERAEYFVLINNNVNSAPQKEQDNNNIHQLDEQQQQYPSPSRPLWYADPIFDGSLPSRILPHLYLGGINHAVNADLLRSLGITHILSAGESALTPRLTTVPPSSIPSPPSQHQVASHPKTFKKLVNTNLFKKHKVNGSGNGNGNGNGLSNTNGNAAGNGNGNFDDTTVYDDQYDSINDYYSQEDENDRIMRLNSLIDCHRKGEINIHECKRLSDDGIDPILPFFESSLQFIEEARRQGGKVLVHCRVGVSRSATLVIAYCMRYLSISLVASYLLVRARRLNILIQPTILFMWTLHDFEAQEINRYKQNARRLMAEYNSQQHEQQKNDSLKTIGHQQEQLASNLSKDRINWPFLARETYRLNQKYLG